MFETYSILHKKPPSGKAFFLEDVQCYRALLFLQGKGTLYSERENFLLREQEIALLPAGLPVQFQAEGPELCSFYQIAVQPAFLQALGEGDDLSACFSALRGPLVLHPGSDNILLMVSILQRLISPEQATQYAAALYRKNAFTIAMILLNRCFLNAQDSLSPTASGRQTLDPIFIYIRDHISEDLSLDTLAKQFYFNKFSLARTFKAATGTTLHRYIIQRKLDLCKELIRQGLSITSIYKQCGFGGYNNLFRVFKKEFGITPKEYYQQIHAAAENDPDEI